MAEILAELVEQAVAALDARRRRREPRWTGGGGMTPRRPAGAACRAAARAPRATS